jgi:nucleoside-diphosphate-sugar epimerase
MTRRVLVTGASGFIGRHCLPLLARQGYEIHAVSSSPRSIPAPATTWHQVDLFDTAAVSAVLRSVRPTHLLHLAWYVIPGKLSEAPENFDWLQASLELVRQFRECGGQRLAVAGSGFEYDWSYGYCSESTPQAPSTFYGVCKQALFTAVDGYASRTGLSSVWPRLFFLYGPHEHPGRLVPSVIRALLRGEPARCSHGLQVRDYLHVEDASDALVRVFDSELTGAMNIGSGHPVMLRDIILGIARRIGAEDLVLLGAVPSRPNDTPLVVANVARLSSALQWQPSYGLDEGLEHTIAWWKQQAA